MQITRTSMVSGKTHTLDLPVTPEQLEAFTSGRLLIQEALPHLSDDDREFILTGITSEEWDATFPDDEDDLDDDEPAF